MLFGTNIYTVWNKLNNMRSYFKYKKIWSWPRSVENFIFTKAKGFTLHVCSGQSKIGNVKVDLYEDCDVRADMCSLPFKPGVFDTVICDPPWKIRSALRGRLLCELRDVLRPEGVLILNSTWLPAIPGLVIKEIWARVINRYWGNVTLITVAKRIKQPIQEQLKGGNL